MSADDTFLDLTPFLAPERAVLLELLRGLSASDWEQPTECRSGTSRASRCTFSATIFAPDPPTRRVDRQLDLVRLEPPRLEFSALLDGFNEQWVAASGFFSTELLVDMLRLVGEWSDAFYRDVGLGTMSREPVGFFAEQSASPYWQVIAREYVERFIHQSQIRRAIGAPELEGELVTAAARHRARARGVVAEL